MKTILALWMLCASLWLKAEQWIPFHAADQKLKVYRMDSVLIMADSAYVISGARAQLLNDKLRELKSVYQAYDEQLTVNATLLTRIETIEGLVRELMARMQEDQELVSLQLDDLLTDLDQQIRDLQDTNQRLDEQNALLERQLVAMEATIQRLKRTIRTLKWRSAMEKVLIGLAGVGIGWLLGN